MRRRAVLFVFAVVAGVGTGSAPAGGDAPHRVGWWTAANLGIPQLVAFVPRLPPDNVPDGGFEVGGTTDAPTSYAALLYDVPRGATIGSLVLPLAEGAAPAADPAAAVQACPLTGTESFATDDGGPMADAPPFDCADAAVGELAGDGLTFAFDVAALVRDGVLAVAIVPVESTPVVFAPPGEESLSISGVDAVAPLGPTPSVSSPRPAPPTFSVPDPPAVTVAPTAPEVAASPVTSAPAATIASRTAPPPAGMGAGSAVIGSVLVVVLGAVVARRARRALAVALD